MGGRRQFLVLLCFMVGCQDREPMSFEEFKQVVKQLYNASPKITHTVDDMIVEGDKVVARITAHTVHEGEFLGIPATGKTLEWSAIAIFQLSDGKIKARWEIADMQLTPGLKFTARLLTKLSKV